MLKPRMDKLLTGLLLVFGCLHGSILDVQAKPQNYLNLLEQQVLGQKYSRQPLSIRIQRLEQHFSIKNNAKSSENYRLARLSQAQGIEASSRQRGLAIEAYNQGVDLEKAGRKNQAMSAYRQAIQQDPSMVEPYNNLANLLMQDGKYEETVSLYQRALEQDPKNPVLHRNLGLLYEKSGKIDKAVDEYEHYLQQSKNPDRPIQEMVETYRVSRKIGMATPDYYSAVSHASQGQPLIWQQNNPIQVFIRVDQPNQMYALPLIQQGLSTWEKVTDHRLKFKQVRWVEDANIMIQLKEAPLIDPHTEIGHAEFQMPEEQLNQHRMSLVAITLNTGTPESWKTLSSQSRDEQFYRMALHEIGHAIGIWGHSPDPGDIMFTHPIASDLSERDIRTVRKLYGL